MKTTIWTLVIIQIVVLGVYGLVKLGQYIAYEPPLTVSQSWHDGYGDALSDEGYPNAPWGKYSCVTDWDGQITGNPDKAGFAAGGPTSTHLITWTNQNTHSRLGNAWMAGCRAGLRASDNGRI